MSLITQTMPLVALAPLLVLLLGRGVTVTVAVTMSVTFFPAFVTIAQGLELVPGAGFELVRADAARSWRALRPAMAGRRSALTADRPETGDGEPGRHRRRAARRAGRQHGPAARR